MTRMTCSKDACFVREVWRPCTFTEQEQYVRHGVLVMYWYITSYLG